MKEHTWTDQVSGVQYLITPDSRGTLAVFEKRSPNASRKKSISQPRPPILRHLLDLAEIAEARMTEPGFVLGGGGEGPV